MDRLASVNAFIGVVENGGFSAAARHLNVSRTMVSSHVQELEDRLGARLLNRTTRRVSLTEVGRQYYERSIHFLAEIDEAGALQATPRGRLRVHCHPTLARFIAPVVTAYLRDNPDVSVDLRRGDQMIDLLEEEFDLAIRLNVPPDSSLMVRRLATGATYCAALPRISRPIPSRRAPPIFRPTTAFATPSTRSGTSGASSTRTAGRSRRASRETSLRPTWSCDSTLLSPALGWGSFRLSISMRSFEPVPSCRCCVTTQHPSSRSRRSIRTVSIWRRRCECSSTRSPSCSPGATG
jgi:DNA-binding transcriptional LysR family regulator